MLFGTHYKTKQCNNVFKFSLDGVEIDHVNTFKFLGISNILKIKNLITLELKGDLGCCA